MEGVFWGWRKFKQTTDCFPTASQQESMCEDGFPIKDFGNDDYCSYYLLGFVLD